MNRTVSLLMTVVMIVGMAAVIPAAGLAQSSQSVVGAVAYNQEAPNANASNVTAGERLSGVMRVQAAEFEGELQTRTFGIKVARAKTADAKAEIVQEQLGSIQQRLTELEQRKHQLQQARENGEISEGRFAGEMAQLTAETETVKQLSNASESRAQELPRDILERKGINVSAIQQLKQNAENLTGPEVATIARSIAGPSVGQPMSQGPPGQVGLPQDRGATAGPPAGRSQSGQAGAPSDRGSSSDKGSDGSAESTVERAAQRVEAARGHVDRAKQRVGDNASEDASDALDRAEAQLDRAEKALQDARTALDTGNEAEAIDLAEQAIDHTRQAEQYAQDAIDRVQEDEHDSDRQQTDDQDGSQDGGDDGTEERNTNNRSTSGRR